MDNLIPSERIERRILAIRGQRVMLDRDLAQAYGVTAIRLREQVKRNRERFPTDFVFQLTETEAQAMVSQNAIPSRQYLGGHLPYAFTEHGAVMLAAVLKNPVAVAASIQIVRAFNQMRRMLVSHQDLARKLGELDKKCNRRFRLVFQALEELMAPAEKPHPKIGFQP